jgi:hypothetical protein
MTTDPVLKIGASSSGANNTILRLTRTTENVAPLDKQQYGYNLIYNNTNGSYNALAVWCDSGADTNQIIGCELNQKGCMGIGMAANNSYRLSIKGGIGLTVSNSFTNSYTPILTPLLSIKPSKTSMRSTVQLIDNP